MDIPTDLVTDFCRVTNADEVLASQLLRDSGLDLQSAIQSFFAIQEAGGIPDPDVLDEPPRESSPPLDEDPIIEYPQPRNEPPGRSSRSFFPAAPSRRPPPPAPSRRQVDTALSDPFADDVEEGNARSESLAALFRPPTHLVHSGSLNEAMITGRAQQRWILVNIQRNDIFASHVMNRDVWSDSAMQQIIQAHFVFWQREERVGQDYTRFYSYSSAPHVAIIDPRSGERARLWGDNGDIVGKDVLLDGLQDFVSGNSLDSDRVIRGRTGQSVDRQSGNPSASASTLTMDVDAGASPEDLDEPIDLTSEDAQLAAAIAASMEDDTANDDNDESTSAQNRAASRILSATDPSLSRSRSIRAEQDELFRESLALDRAKAESERSEQLRKQLEEVEAERRERERAEQRDAKRRRVPLEPSKDAKEKITELAIRLPNGKRLQRRFLASDNIGCVYDFIETEAEDLDGVEFELMQAYPKKSFADREIPLEELAPKAALVVHLKD